jgi:hypothetical protein
MIHSPPSPTAALPESRAKSARAEVAARTTTHTAISGIQRHILIHAFFILITILREGNTPATASLPFRHLIMNNHYNYVEASFLPKNRI